MKFLHLFYLLLLSATVLASPVTLDNFHPGTTNVRISDDSDIFEDAENVFSSGVDQENPKNYPSRSPDVDVFMGASDSESDGANFEDANDECYSGVYHYQENLVDDASETENRPEVPPCFLDLLPNDLLQVVYSRLNVFDKKKFQLLARPLKRDPNDPIGFSWGPEELEFIQSLKTEEAYLNQYRYYNEHERLETFMVPQLVRLLKVDESLIRQAVEETSDMIRIPGNYNSKSRIQILFQNLKRFGVPNVTEDDVHTAYFNAKRELAQNNRDNKLEADLSHFDYDWRMDIELALTLSGNHCSETTFLENVRKYFIQVYNSSCVFLWGTFESNMHPSKRVKHSTLDDYKKRLAEMLPQEIRKPFNLREDFQRARRTIKREKLNRPNNAGPYDDDTRMTELLADMLKMDLLEVDAHMRRARANVEFNIAVSQKKSFAVCKYIGLSAENFEIVVEMANKARSEEGKMLLQFPFFSSEFLENLLNDAVEWALVGEGPSDVQWEKDLEIIYLLLKHPAIDPRLCTSLTGENVLETKHTLGRLLVQHPTHSSALVKRLLDKALENAIRLCEAVEQNVGTAALLEDTPEWRRDIAIIYSFFKHLPRENYPELNSIRDRIAQYPSIEDAFKKLSNINR